MAQERGTQKMWVLVWRMVVEGQYQELEEGELKEALQAVCPCHIRLLHHRCSYNLTCLTFLFF